MHDVGFTHIALSVTNLDDSIAFYAAYASFEVVHRREGVVWLSDKTRPFVLVLAEADAVNVVLAPFAHLGIGCVSRDKVDQLCDRAREEGCLIGGPNDFGPPVGYWAFIRDPDGHTLELSYGQDVGLTVEKAGGSN